MNTNYIQMHNYVYVFVNNLRENGLYPSSRFSQGSFSTQKYGALEALRQRYPDFQVITDNVAGKHLGDINVRE